MKAVIAGGGTAGHVNPALALARALRGDEITFVGTARGAEAHIVPTAGFPLVTIDVRGLDRGALLRAPGVAWRAVSALRESRKILRSLSPDVVVGMGGYVSLPVCVAARLARVPVVVHEQNVVFGLANRLCKPLARAVAVSFEESLAVAGRKGIFVGNPIAEEIAAADADAERKRALERFELDPARKTLLVFGGSQGAARINEAARGLAEEWGGRADRQVVHVLGRARAADQAPRAEAGGLIYRVVDFVERMVEAYAVADVALCRGGATTVAEITAMGLPAVIVPYPHHRDRQQERHARILEAAGAAVVVADEDAGTATVARIVDELLDDDARLAEMGRAAESRARRDAAARLADVVRAAA